MYALVDCNNFYASCERVFKPHLIDKPIVILSNNDGCVIARSNEAKALGIPMGAPFFKIRGLCRQQGVHVFSSNFSLYGDMSRRVMSIIEESWQDVAVYSIDEAFLDLKTLPLEDQEPFCRALQKKILQYTGIPVSIGLAQTKTLAKLANYVAKRRLHVPFFNWVGQNHWLSQIEIGEVWGIGRKWHKVLMQQGIYWASDLAALPLQTLKTRFNVVLQRTALELRGIPCIGFEESEERKSILSSRSFGSLQREQGILAQALSAHCARAYEKLRQQHSVAGYLGIFIRTNPFRADLPQYAPSLGVCLPQPTDDLRELTRWAKWCLNRIYRSGFQYNKVGVYLGDLQPQTVRQPDLFDSTTPCQQQQTRRFLAVYDAINQKYGGHMIRLGAQGHTKPWAMRSAMRSPCYTTRWSDLLVVK
ncbi:DUF4113 domain-containing protein [Legionella sp. MW5194]|uniref:Y-family DNA polymerase n=1 Tax=Legionella sp. MW5194 TaxID=2662448 RepID=UPI00193EB03E|nr:Y-family DNA polymerase [Legionella sp. MW5194]QRN03102.1 DUF4113 domain-containing protein [Legionella sp. MW5194]